MPEDMAVVLEAGGEMGARVAGFDWSATSLGPMAEWPASVRTLVRTALTSRFPIVLWFGDDLTLVYNDGYLPMLGEKHPGALGRPGKEVWAEIWDIIGPMLHGVVSTGVATWSDDQRLVILRGGFPDESFFTFTYSPVHDGTGAVSGVFCAVHETTEKVVGERRLRALGELADRLNEASSEDEVFGLTAASLGAHRPDLPFLALYTPAADGTVRRRAVMAGDEAARAFPERLASDSPWLAAAQSSGELAELALPGTPHRTMSGARKPRVSVVTLSDPEQQDPVGWLVCGLSPLRSFDHEYQSFLRLIGSHISGGLSRVRTLALERERAEALAEIDRAKTTFFSNVSHELRTPLTLMLAPLDDVLAADPATSLGEHHDPLDIAHRNGLRLLKLVNTLLDFSRMEAGRQAGRFAPVDLGTVTADLASVFRSAIESAGLRFDVDLQPLDQPVFVDLDMWEKIVFNLLSNAVKYTLHGGISVRVEGDETGARMIVADTGIGLAPGDLDRVFDRFTRIDSASGRSVEGTGIGLALTRELVEQHGGGIAVDSTPGRGTTFTVTLPWGSHHLRAEQLEAAAPGARAADAQPFLEEVAAWLSPTLGLASPDRADRAEGGSGDAGSGGPSAVILVVDDNADMREYVRRILSARWAVLLAANGTEGLHLAQRHHPDVVVTDVMMPGLDGFELLARLREDEQLHDTPVLMLSARAGQESAVDGLDAGAQDYLVKPFTAAELSARVQARLQSSARLAAEARRNRRSVLMAEAAAALNTTRTMPDVTRTVFDHLSGEVGASMLTIGVVDSADPVLHVHFAGEVPTDLRLRYRAVPLDARTPLTDIARTNRRLVLDRDALHRSYPHTTGDFDLANIHSLVGLPLRGPGGTTIGAVTFGRAEPERFSAEQVMAVMAVADMVAEAIARVQLYELATHTSTSLQQGLLQLDLAIPDAVWSARYRPSTPPLEVGGDWYDLFALDDHRLGVTIGDVVGQGLPAATVMGQLRSALSAVALDATDPADAIDSLDHYARRVPGAFMATVAYAVIDPVAQTVHHHAAGHPPPLLITPDGHVGYLEAGRSWPLVGDGSPRTPAAAVDFPPGSLLFVYTDGLIERRGQGLDTGLEQLADVAGAVRNLPTGVFCDTVLEQLCPTGPAYDDIAVVAVRTVATQTGFLAHTFPSDPGALSPTRRRMRDWLRDQGLTREARDAWMLALGEACTNAIEHGNSLQPHRLVDVQLAAHDGQIVASITDTGTWTPNALPGYESGRGRGLTLMQQLVDHIRVDTTTRGTTVTLRKAIDLP